MQLSKKGDFWSKYWPINGHGFSSFFWELFCPGNSGERRSKGPGIHRAIFLPKEGSFLSNFGRILLPSFARLFLRKNRGFFFSEFWTINDLTGDGLWPPPHSVRGPDRSGGPDQPRRIFWKCPFFRKNICVLNFHRVFRVSFFSTSGNGRFR